MFFYFDQIAAAMHSEKGVLGRMKMLSQRFARSLPNGEQLRSKLVRSQSTTELRELATEYFLSLEQLEAGNQNAFLSTMFNEEAPSKHGGRR
jgi:hypothetical protein